ncbi:hypothetical protein FRC07_012001, partial [Ceratobasidium sp. 392]
MDAAGPSVHSPPTDKPPMNASWGNFDFPPDDPPRLADSFGRTSGRTQTPHVDLSGLAAFNSSGMGAFPSPPLAYPDPTTSSVPSFPPGHPLAMADPTHVLQQLTAQRAAAALMQSNMASPWSNFQTNLLTNPASKPKSQRLKLQTGPSPTGSSHNSRVNTPSLPSSPLRLNHREIEQTASTSRGSPGVSPVDYSTLKPKRKSALEQSALPGASLPDPKPLPEPVYHPDSAAGQSLVQEAALENLGLSMGIPGAGFGPIMTPYGPLPYELAARAGVVPGWPSAQFAPGFASLSNVPTSHPPVRPNIPPSLWMSPSNVPASTVKPQQSNLSALSPTIARRTPGTSPGTSISTSTSAALSSFASGPVSSSTSSVSPPSLGKPSPPALVAKPKDQPGPPSNGRRSPSIVSDILADDFFSTRPTAIGQSLNESGGTATAATRRPTV